MINSVRPPVKTFTTLQDLIGGIFPPDRDVWRAGSGGTTLVINTDFDSVNFSTDTSRPPELDAPAGEFSNVDVMLFLQIWSEKIADMSTSTMLTNIANRKELMKDSIDKSIADMRAAFAKIASEKEKLKTQKILEWVKTGSLLAVAIVGVAVATAATGGAAAPAAIMAVMSLFSAVGAVGVKVNEEVGGEFTANYLDVPTLMGLAAKEAGGDDNTVLAVCITLTVVIALASMGTSYYSGTQVKAVAEQAADVAEVAGAAGNVAGSSQSAVGLSQSADDVAEVAGAANKAASAGDAAAAAADKARQVAEAAAKADTAKHLIATFRTLGVVLGQLSAGSTSIAQGVTQLEIADILEEAAELRNDSDEVKAVISFIEQLNDATLDFVNQIVEAMIARNDTVSRVVAETGAVAETVLSANTI